MKHTACESVLFVEVGVVAELEPDLGGDLDEPVRVAHALEEVAAVEVCVRGEALAEGADGGYVPEVDVQGLLEVQGFKHRVLGHEVFEELEEAPGDSRARGKGEVQDGVGWHDEA